MTGLLDRGEIAWLDAYHARVAAAVAPLVAEPVRAWLVAGLFPSRNIRMDLRGGLNITLF